MALTATRVSSFALNRRNWAPSRTQPELRFIAVFLLESCLPLLLRQAGAMASVLSPLEILFKLPIALSHLLLAKFVTILFLLQHEQQIFLPITFETSCNLLLTGLHTRIPKCSQLMRISLAGQNRVDDCLSRHSANVRQHVGQLEIHLRQRLLDPVNMSARTLYQIIALPPVGPHGANLLRRAE